MAETRRVTAEMRARAITKFRDSPEGKHFLVNQDGSLEQIHPYEEMKKLARQVEILAGSLRIISSWDEKHINEFTKAYGDYARHVLEDVDDIATPTKQNSPDASSRQA